MFGKYFFYFENDARLCGNNYDGPWRELLLWVCLPDFVLGWIFFFRTKFPQNAI